MFDEVHRDVLITRSGDVLADVVGTQRQFTMAAVDQDRQLHRSGPAEVAQGVEGRPDGAPGIEHVVDEDDDGVVDATARHHGALERAMRFGPQIITVEGDVEVADRDVGAGELVDLGTQTGRETRSAGGDSDEDDARRVG